jgi:hypothetical protein
MLSNEEKLALLRNFRYTVNSFLEIDLDDNNAIINYSGNFRKFFISAEYQKKPPYAFIEKHFGKPIMVLRGPYSIKNWGEVQLKVFAPIRRGGGHSQFARVSAVPGPTPENQEARARVFHERMRQLAVEGKRLPLQDYLNETAFVWEDVIVKNSHVVAFVCNKVGGVHFEFEPSDEKEFSLLRQAYISGIRPSINGVPTGQRFLGGDLVLGIFAGIVGEIFNSEEIVSIVRRIEGLSEEDAAGFLK